MRRPAQGAGRQRGTAGRLDLGVDEFQQRPGLFYAQRLTRGVIETPCTRLSIDGKQFIDPHHNARCRRIVWVELGCFNELSS